MYVYQYSDLGSALVDFREDVRKMGRRAGGVSQEEEPQNEGSHGGVMCETHEAGPLLNEAHPPAEDPGRSC